MAIRRTLLNGERTAYFDLRYTDKITPTIAPTIAPTVSTVPGRDADGVPLPGWFESYCVPGSSLRKIINGVSTCPMIFRGLPTTPYVAPAYVAPTVIPTPYTKPLPPAPVDITSPYDYDWTPQPGMAYPAIPIYSSNPEIRKKALQQWASDTYARTGKMPEGWIQPMCIMPPCPPMYVGDNEPWVADIFEMPLPDGGTVVIATDDDGDVIGTVEKKPNWLPLALAAGAAYFFMM